MAATAEYVYTTRVCEPFNYQYYTLFRGGTYDQLPRGPYCQSHKDSDVQTCLRKQHAQILGYTLVERVPKQT